LNEREVLQMSHRIKQRIIKFYVDLLEDIGATSADCAQARMKLNKKVDIKNYSEN